MKIVFQGSSVTGQSYNRKVPFDANSDLDVGLVSPELLGLAKSKGIKLRGKGTRSEPLSPNPHDFEVDGMSPADAAAMVEKLKNLGLYEVTIELQTLLGGRRINYMIYESLEAAIAQAAKTSATFLGTN